MTVAISRNARSESVCALSLAHSRPRAADIAAGKEKAELCAGCHGENGISQTENIPSLAGQPDQFIQWQLVFFRAGSRKNEQMQPIVEQLNNEDIRNLGAYFASLTPPKARGGQRSGPVEKGRAGGRRPPLRLMPHRQLCRHQGGGARSPASARNISSRRCTTTNQQRALRRRPGAAMADVAYPHERRRDHALSRIISRISSNADVEAAKAS